MIDTDKYTGHTPGPWKRSSQMGFKSESVFDRSGRQIASVKLAGYDTKRVKETSTNLLLIADAPLLHEEVKRLRSGMQDILDDFETTKTDMWSIIKRIQELIE